jgi:hypothetical protein
MGDGTPASRGRGCLFVDGDLEGASAGGKADQRTRSNIFNFIMTSKGKKHVQK